MTGPGRTLVILLAPRRDRLGNLVKAKGSPTLLRDAGARLRDLAEAGETPDARAEAEAALACPWWSLRVLAVETIGRWGGRRNKAWLVARANRPVSLGSARRLPRGDPARWRPQETLAARAALLPHLDERDAGWLLDLWFADPDGASSLRGALPRLPVAVVEARARHEAQHASGCARHALLWLVSSVPALPCRDEVLRRLARDGDKLLACLAGRALQRFAPAS